MILDALTGITAVGLGCRRGLELSCTWPIDTGARHGDIACCWEWARERENDS